MIRYKNTSHTKLRRGLAILFFLITLLLILLLYPNNKHFRYSYQMGKPWQYETLFSPFQFSIKKSAKQINEEQEKRLAKAIPYYNFDKNIGKQEVSKATKEGNLTEKNIQLLKNIYAESILSLDTLASKNTKIFVIKNHIATRINLNDLQTVAKISNYINQKEITPQQKTLLKSYIKPNLNYDKEQTKSLNSIENVSAYWGEKQANELIISKGEIVTKETYLVLDSLRNEYANRIGKSSNFGVVLVGQFLFVALCLLLLYFYLRNYRPNILEKPIYLSFILLGIIAAVSLTRIALSFEKAEIFLIPYVLFAIIIRTFMDSRTASFFYLSTIVICSFIGPNSYEFLTMQLVTGILAILYLKYLDRRSQLLVTSLIVFCSYSILYFAIFSTSEGNLSTLNLTVFIRFLLNAIFLTIAYPLLYLLEKAFGFLSDVTLIELSNTNNKLLRELSQEAPGTFQHSLQVGNLAEEAVRKIGGNPLLVRAGALYHDIGKMNNPIYFTENQYGETSPHKELSYEESAKIIIKHVTDGIKMAKKYNLPSQLIDFIATHHGKGRTEYFYRSEMNENPDKEVDISDFTYPGPDPFTKEQAILMMADSSEAATRSLKKKTEANIRKMVSGIIDSQKEEGRFNNAPITFQDIEEIKQIFIKKLANIYHSRIAYPEKNTTENGEK